MKKKFIPIIFSAAAAIIGSGCTKDFEEINVNPDTYVETELPYLFTYSLNYLKGNIYLEWYYENDVYYTRYLQMNVTKSGNPTNWDMGSDADKQGYWFSKIMPNLFDIRQQIDAMPEEKAKEYKGLYYASYIAQIYFGLRVTDVRGDQVYKEAMRLRVDPTSEDPSALEPKWDEQKDLLLQFEAELKNSRDQLWKLSEEGQNSNLWKSGDFIYDGNVKKWAQLANTLLLRLSLRYDGVEQDKDKMKQIAQEAQQSPVDFIENIDDAMKFDPASDFRGDGNDYQPGMACTNFMEVLKEANDTRVMYMFERNSFNDTIIENLQAHNATVPDYILEAYNSDGGVDSFWERYYGGPADPAAVKNGGKYFDEYSYTDNKGGKSSVYPLSYRNRRFVRPQWNDGSGTYGYELDYMVSSSEVHFIKAELIERGILSGDSKQEFTTGVIDSYNEMDEKAKAAKAVDYDLLKNIAEGTDAAKGQLDMTPDQIAKNYLDMDGTMLEKIYLQQYITYTVNPAEAYVMARRTGFPWYDGKTLVRERMMIGGSELQIPRHMIMNSMNTEDLGYTEWKKAMDRQGFKTGEISPMVLSQERVWYDKGPKFGEHASYIK